MRLQSPAIEILGLAVCLVPGASALAAPPMVEKYLHEGRLAEGENALSAEFGRHPKDDQLRFGLGALQFARAVEHLGQSLHRYGLRSDRGQQLGIPILRLPVANNSKPDTVTYLAGRKILQELIDDLSRAEATLSQILSLNRMHSSAGDLRCAAREDILRRNG